VLEALGVRIDLTRRKPRIHCANITLRSSLRQITIRIQVHCPGAQTLRERGQRTIFNFLGPLLNPARPSAMLVGVPRPELCEPIACVLQSLGVRRAMVVCGSVRHKLS